MVDKVKVDWSKIDIAGIDTFKGAPVITIDNIADNYSRSKYDTYVALIKDGGGVKAETPKEKPIPKPYQIKQYLDEYVIGQEDAKIALSVAAYNHYNRRKDANNNFDTIIQKSNILMVGKSGCGKTLLVETLARFLDVPFVSIDITEFTPTGYVGRTITEVSQRLLDKANGDIKKASYGIVFIDEIDKISTSTEYNGAQKLGVTTNEIQASLLKYIEGKDTSVSSNNGFFSSTKSDFSTNNVLFVCAGAFSGIEKMLTQSTTVHKTVGFGVENNNTKNIGSSKQLEPQDIIKYGLMPEIVGRLPVLVHLTPLGKEDFIKILTEPKNSIMSQYERMFKRENVELDITDDALDAIADIAITTETGARGLRTILEKTIMKLMFDVTSSESIERVEITGDCISGNSKPIIYEKQNMLKVING